MRNAYLRLEAALADELIQRIRSGTPAFFESLVVRLLVGMGYGGGSVTDISKALVGGTSDGGVDGVIDQDPLGLDRIYIQAKRYADSNTVGAGAIRDFFWSLDLFKARKGWAGSIQWVAKEEGTVEPWDTSCWSKGAASSGVTCP
jgi:restriction system protein